MKKIFKFGILFSVLFVCVGTVGSFAAVVNTAKKQAALQFGTKVRTRLEASGVYDQSCYDKYYSCMDQFCISDNELGGSCACSDDITKYEQALDDIKKIVAEAERISLEEVEKVKAGANADIIFRGTRQYDENNNVVKASKNEKDIKTNLWSAFYGDDEDEEIVDDISSLHGEELYNAANALCINQIEKECSKDLNLLNQIYLRQITSDCKGLANSIEQKRQEAKSQLMQANASVRAALKESLEESNKYDRGTCMVEYRNCMKTDDACGPDWGQCVSTIADENMQNNEAKSTARTKVEKKVKYKITPSTMERLEAKRFVCEKVLDKCVAVRDYVWNDFLRDIAPTILVAESNVESQKRQSCLKNISDCIQNACKDDIANKGVATMDACLSNPDMARSFCKIQIDPCERMEPQIWSYVRSKLEAMRVDACVKEVKDCYTAEDRCGQDFSNCIGMDYNYIHDICPIDTLVTCKATKDNFQMSDLDSLLMGLFLNIDNNLLEDCENLAESKMLEVCGSTTECNILAADDYIGSGSVRMQKDGEIYRVTGMISFGSIKIAGISDEKKGYSPGEIIVSDYIKEVKKNSSNMEIPDADAIVGVIEHELNNIAGTINRTISLLESDQRIQYCINGRDLSQIQGGKRGKKMTTARFPNLLYQYRTMIGLSALRKAQDNYNKKVEEEIAKASKNASADVAQYLCQKMSDVGNGFEESLKNTPTKSLTPPYAIYYEIASGVPDEELKAVSGSSTMSSNEEDKLESGNGSGTLTERIATFDRDSRICKICTTITKQSCNKSKKTVVTVFGGSGDKKNKCDVEVEDMSCEETPM